MKHFYILIASLFSIAAAAQNHTPVLVTGYNLDVIAESSPALNSTTGILDGSDYVLYTTNYGEVFSTGVGLPNDGSIVSGNTSYQLNSVNADNGLILSTGQTDSLDLVTPASYSSFSLLGFSTEGPGTLLVVVKFTNGDGTVFSNLSLPDWFFNPNEVISGFDRTGRETNMPDFQSGEPRMYAVNFNLSCEDQEKVVRSIMIINITPNPSIKTCLFALSGTPVVSAELNGTDVTCFEGNDGQIQAVASGLSPYTYSWNTTPQQTSATATGLEAGEYTVTVTDATECSSEQTISITAPAAPLTFTQSQIICAGETLMVGDIEHTAAGTYIDTIPSEAGCDSIVTTNLSVNQLDLIVMNANHQLTASTTNDQFQWVDCADGFSPIAGETAHIFEPSSDGNYAVIVTQNNCSDTSECIAYSTVGLDEHDKISMKLYPNPAENEVTIECSEAIESIIVTDMSGTAVAAEFSANHLFIGELSSGIYFVTARSKSGKQFTGRLVRN